MQAHTVPREAVAAGTDLRYSDCAGGASLHMTRCAALPHGAGAPLYSAPFRSGPTHFAAAGSAFFYDSFCSSELHLRLHFSFGPAKIEKRSKEKKLPPTSAPCHRPIFLPLRGHRAQTAWAGSCTSVRQKVHRRCAGGRFAAVSRTAKPDGRDWVIRI